MKPKKYKKADLNKKTNLFLQLGLIVVLLLSYFVIQWKTYSPLEDIQSQATISSAEDETVIPITVLPTPPPPVIPKAPKVIDVVPNDTPVIEDPFISTEKEDAPMLKVTDIIEAPKEDPIAVPFEFIEEVPIFPGCENLDSNAEKKDCMSAKITKFIHKNFDAELGEKLGLSGINRISILFQINIHGNITNLQIRAPHPKLKQEAERVIMKLPQMEPGKQRGKPVPVSYSLPIIFQVK